MLELTSLSDSKLSELLRQGAVGVMPTDTLYGIVCRADDEKAVKRLYLLKKRENKPGTVIAANIEQLVKLGLKARYLKAVEQFWPNPLSIIIPSHNLAYIHLGLGSIAVRIPTNAMLRQLLEKVGPLLTTSANHSGKPHAQNVAEAQSYFGDQVDFYVSADSILIGKPSTVIRIVDDAVEVLREGAVKIDVSGRILQ